MNKKKIFDLNKQIPDGEGFNALPIAFVYTVIVIARAVLPQTKQSPWDSEIASPCGLAMTGGNL